MVKAVSRTHSLVWALRPFYIPTEPIMSIARINRSTRKYGKQKTTCLHARTGARKAFATPTPGQLTLIEKAKGHQTLFAI